MADLPGFNTGGLSEDSEESELKGCILFNVVNKKS